MLGKDYEQQDCTLARALEVVGERWTLLILRDAFYGVRRFNDFAAHLDVPRAVLAGRLRGLVEAGLLERGADPERGERAVYRLTEDGRELWPALHALMRWGLRYHADPRRTRSFAHVGCGAALDAGGVCPSCGAVPEARDVVTAGPADGPHRDDAVSHALHPPRRLLDPLLLDGDAGRGGGEGR